MTDHVQSAMLEMLKRIQTDVSGLKIDVSGLKTDVSSVKGRMDGFEGRMEKLEALVRKQGRDSAAMLVMMRGTVGIYDERMKVIEEDVRLIMERE